MSRSDSWNVVDPPGQGKPVPLLTLLLGHSTRCRELTIKFRAELERGLVSCGHGIGRMRALSVDTSAAKTVLFGFGSQLVSCMFFFFLSFLDFSPS